MNDWRQQFIMMVGIPGSGKSYIAERMESEAKDEWNADIVIHSSDNLRAELFGDINDQDHNSELFEELHKRIKDDLANGKTVIYDATNLNKKRRKAFLKEIKKFDCKKSCVLILSTLEECMERNLSRDRSIPNDVIKRMYMNFQPPSLDEGWEEIFLVYNFLDTEYAATYNLDDFFYGKINACEIDQENEHHSKTIGYHCLAVYEYLREHYSDDVILQIAGLMHDIGKPFTKTNVKPNGEIDAQYHYYNHGNVGAYDSFFYSLSLNLPEYDRVTVANLIFYHMLPFSWNTDKIKEKYKNRLGELMYNRLIQLHEADTAESKGEEHEQER